MENIKIHQFFCRNNSNFGVLVHDQETGSTAAIDVPESKAVENAIEETGWKLSDIIITHHHMDHVEGLPEIKGKFGAKVYGPAKSADNIGNIDQRLNDGDSFKVGNIDVRVIATPGHTLDMLSYHMPQANAAFTGDTLFAMGCGRVFEGDAAMMWSSLHRLIQELAPDTKIYCGHEMSFANAKFAVTVDTENTRLRERMAEVEQLTNEGRPTLPTTMELELATNPFLRTQDPSILKNLNMNGESAEAVFAEIRKRKDNF